MRHLWKVLVLFLAFLLDTTLGVYIGILDVSPSFLLVAIVAMAMVSVPVEAGIYGFAAGFILDLCWGRTFGFYTLLYLYIALGARFFLEFIYKNTPRVTAGITFAASFFADVLLLVFGFTVWGEGNFLYALFRMVIPAAAYNAILQMLLFHPITAISKPKTERGTRL